MEESSMAEKEKGNLVYICVATGDYPWGDITYVWYSLNPTANHIEKLEEMSAVTSYPLHCGCARLRDNIYFIGGSNCSGDRTVPGYGYPWSEVKIFNTITNNWDIDKAKPMHAARTCPIVFSLDTTTNTNTDTTNGCLYVFGCISSWESVYPFAERYDPVKNEWSVLNKPPDILRKSEYLHGRAVDHLGHRFLLWNDKLFCAYDWVSDKWECIPPTTLTPEEGKSDMGWFFYNGSFVAKDSFLYWYFCGDLFAYDLSGIQTFTQPLLQFHQSYPSHRPNHRSLLSHQTSPFMVALGDAEKHKHQLCLIWKQYDCTDLPASTFPLCWATFDIERPEFDRLLAVSKPCGCTGVPYGSEILFCLPVECHNITNSSSLVPAKRKYGGENEKPQVPDAPRLLAELPLVIYGKNENSYNMANKEDFVEVKYETEDVYSVTTLLRSLKLDKYVNLFVENRIGMAKLKVLEEKDLKGYGLPMGPRKQLLLAIR